MAGTDHLGLFNPALGVDCVADRAFALDTLVQRPPWVSRCLLGNRQVLTAGRRSGFGPTRLLGRSIGGLLTLLRGKLFGGLALLRLFTLLLFEASLPLALLREPLAFLLKLLLLHALMRQRRLLQLLLGDTRVDLRLHRRKHFRQRSF